LARTARFVLTLTAFLLLAALARVAVLLALVRHLESPAWLLKECRRSAGGKENGNRYSRWARCVGVLARAAA
jgi:hypothetical protein